MAKTSKPMKKWKKDALAEVSAPACDQPKSFSRHLQELLAILKRRPGLYERRLPAGSGFSNAMEQCLHEELRNWPKDHVLKVLVLVAMGQSPRSIDACAEIAFLRHPALGYRCEVLLSETISNKSFAEHLESGIRALAAQGVGMDTDWVLNVNVDSYGAVDFPEDPLPSEAADLPVTRFTLSTDELHALALFAQTIRDLQDSSIIRQGPGQLTQSRDGTFVFTSTLRDAALQKFTAVFRRLYMEDGPVGFLNAVRLFSRIVIEPGLATAFGNREQARQYMEILEQRPLLVAALSQWCLEGDLPSGVRAEVLPPITTDPANPVIAARSPTARRNALWSAVFQRMREVESLDEAERPLVVHCNPGGIDQALVLFTLAHWLRNDPQAYGRLTGGGMRRLSGLVDACVDQRRISPLNQRMGWFRQLCYVHNGVDRYRALLKSQPEFVAGGQRERWPATRGQLIDRFLDPHDTSRPHQGEAQSRGACPEVAGHSDDMANWLSLNALWTVSVDILKTASIILDFFERYCQHHGVDQIATCSDNAGADK